MTDKLKTLKDLAGNLNLEEYGITIKNILTEEKVRQDAIKDIKYLKNLEDDGKMAHFAEETTEKKLGYRKVIVNYIKWKNNVTEEDLKK